ncbi:MAG: IMPACT family protein [bacterium]
MIESYKTLSFESGPVEIKEKGSRFISECFPVLTVEEVDKILKSLKKEHYNATHVCYAYILGNGKIDLFRYNDDGEPTGTAGLPIYNEIIRKELFNVLVTSVRYYGGVKLGTGGLTRAYGASARAVLETAEIKTVIIKNEVVLNASFELTGLVMNHISQFDNIDIISNSYDESGMVLKLNIPVKQVEKFKAELIEKSGGKIVF